MLTSKEITEKISELSVDFLKKNEGILSFDSEIDKRLFDNLIKGAIIQGYVNRDYIIGTKDDFEKY